MKLASSAADSAFPIYAPACASTTAMLGVTVIHAATMIDYGSGKPRKPTKYIVIENGNDSGNVLVDGAYTNELETL